MQILEVKNSDRAQLLQKSCDILAQGGLVLFPTETTYGAGVDATNPEAVAKLLRFKSRREGKPLSIAVPYFAAAEPYAIMNPQAEELAQQFLPGPVTVVVKGKGAVAPGVESEFGTLGIRVPDYELLLELLQLYGKPITATSANGSGEKRPYSVSDILSGLSAQQSSLIDLILDAGELPHNPPSTVIDTTLSAPVTLRAGEIRFGENWSEVGKNAITLTSSSQEETQSIAKRLVLKNWDRLKEVGLVIGLDGALGAGKTIFAKGVAEFLQISETITSPTYNYIEEYEYVRHGVTGYLYHLDMWKVGSEIEFQRLEVTKLLRSKNCVVIEWFGVVEPFLQEFLEKNNVPLLRVTISELGNMRTLQILEPTLSKLQATAEMSAHNGEKVGK